MRPCELSGGAWLALWSCCWTRVKTLIDGSSVAASHKGGGVVQAAYLLVVAVVGPGACAVSRGTGVVGLVVRHLMT